MRTSTLARNSFDACFAHGADKQRWKAEVDGYAAGAAPKHGRYIPVLL